LRQLLKPDIAPPERAGQRDDHEAR
jgi:hypothetical protein